MVTLKYAGTLRFPEHDLWPPMTLGEMKGGAGVDPLGLRARAPPSRCITLGARWP
jgi:hypothetical protein